MVFCKEGKSIFYMKFLEVSADPKGQILIGIPAAAMKRFTSSIVYSP